MTKTCPLDELARRAPNADAPLSELQGWMVELLRQERSLDKSAELRAAAAKHFSGNERLSPAAQINLYRQQFWLRHTGILIDDFPGLSSLLGQKNWEALSQSYLRSVGYRIQALRDLGKHLPEHLGELELPHRDLLKDMAQLEWAYVEAFDAANDSVLNSEALLHLPAESWETARFVLSSSISLLALNYPVADLRRELKLAPEETRERAEKLEPKELFVVVYRRNRNLFDKKISRVAFLLLEQFSQGVPLVAACESVVESNPEAEAILESELMSWFSLWGQLGWITMVLTEESHQPAGPVSEV